MRSTPSLCVCLLFLAACGEESPVPVVTTEDSAGVIVVSNPGEDVPLPWTAEEVLTISPVEDEREGFFEATWVEVTSGGHIAVLDRMAKKVLFYDPEGRLLRQYGREGSGPGEFQYPLAMAPAPDGGLAVFDMRNRRLERFDSTLAPMAPDLFQIPYYGGALGYAGDFLVVPVPDPEAVDVDAQTIRAVREGDTVDVVRYEREIGGPITLESCGLGLSGIPPLFSPTTKWDEGPDGMISVVGTDQYEVDIYRAPTFRLERRIRRDVPPLQSTRETARLEVGTAMRVMTPAGERVCDADEVVDKRGFASHVPPIARVAVSPSGEIFLERWAPGGEARAVDVLDADGVYQGTLAPGFPFPQAFLGPDRFLVTDEDEMELRSVVMYRISR